MTPQTDPAALPRFDGMLARVEQPSRVFVAQIMGLPVSVRVRGPRARAEEVADAVRELFAALRADDERFSTWKPQSPVSRIRRGQLRLEEAGERVREVALLCAEAAERTGGSFSAWRPGPDGRPGFDPTGLVKGWSVEGAFHTLLERLSRLGRYDALVSAGGDVRVACTRIDTPDWVVGIEDPRDRRRVLRTISLRQGAIATSGIAARGEHIVDPATGRPPSGLLSATVVGPSLLWADVYATAAFVRGVTAASWVATLPQHGALLVRSDGRVDTTLTTRAPAAPEVIASAGH